MPFAIVQSLLLCAAQVLLKFALARMEPFGWNCDFFRSLLVNWQLAACGLTFVAASVLWMYMVKVFPFSQVYPMVSLSYVFGMIAAIVFFQESVSATKWAGVALIMAGCVLIAK